MINATQQQFIDSVFGIRDLADPSKLGQFDASAISAAITRVLAFPNASGTIALEEWVDDNFLALDGEGTDVTNGTFDLTTTGSGTFGSVVVTGIPDTQVLYSNANTVAGNSAFTFNDSNGVVSIAGIGDGGFTNYDLKVGDTNGTPTYGMIQMGNSVIGRTSFNAGNIDLDGAILVRNIAGPISGEIEFIWTESAGDTCRFALPKSAVGNATYNSRSMLLAGPAPADTDFVKVSYWQGQGIFHNLSCDTAGDGADLGIQNDLEVEGDIFTDSIKESTSGAGISFNGDNIIATGNIIGIDVTKELGAALTEWAAVHVHGPVGINDGTNKHLLNIDEGSDLFRFSTTYSNDVQIFFTSDGVGTSSLIFQAATDRFAFGSDLLIPNEGLIGSVSDPDAIQITTGGSVFLTQRLRIAGGTGLSLYGIDINGVDGSNNIGTQGGDGTSDTIESGAGGTGSFAGAGGGGGGTVRIISGDGGAGISGVNGGDAGSIVMTTGDGGDGSSGANPGGDAGNFILTLGSGGPGAVVGADGVCLIGDGGITDYTQISATGGITQVGAANAILNIDGGTIDGTVIGGTTPADGTFGDIVCDSITAGEYFGGSPIHMRESDITFGENDSGTIFIDRFAPFGDAWTFRTDNINIEQLILKSRRIVLDVGTPNDSEYEIRSNENQFKFQFNSRPWMTSSWTNRVVQFGGDIFAEQTALPFEFLDKNSATNYIAKIDGFNGTVGLRGNITLDPADGGNWPSAEVLIGDNINHTAFEADGTIEFNGTATVYKDINIGAATLSGPIGLQPDIVNYLDETGADTGIATLGLDVGEGFSGQFEMQHDYKEGSDIVFHIHWQGIDAPSGTDKVQFQLTYTLGKVGETLDATTVITIETDFDTQYESMRSDFVTITGTNFNIEDQFKFTLERIAASANEYGGDVLTATVGIHYEIDTIGSRQTLIK